MKSRHTLYAYVDGADLLAIAEDLEARLSGFIGEHAWRCGTPRIVNERHPDDPSLGAGDLPDWDLGLNYDLPNPGDEPPGWFSDVERIAAFLGSLHAGVGRDFVIGIFDRERRIAEDLFFINSSSPDPMRLRQVIGVGHAGEVGRGMERG